MVFTSIMVLMQEISKCDQKQILRHSILRIGNIKVSREQNLVTEALENLKFDDKLISESIFNIKILLSRKFTSLFHLLHLGYLL